MKKLTDEELQRLLESGAQDMGEGVDPLSKQDLATYRLLFDALKTPPAGGLPYDFSARLVRKLQTKETRAADLKSYCFTMLTVLAVMAGAWLVLNIIGRDTAALFTAIILKYKYLLLFFLGGLLAVQYADQKLIKNKKEEMDLTPAR